MGVFGYFDANAIESPICRSSTKKNELPWNPVFDTTDIDPDILEKYSADSEEAQKAYDAYQSMSSCLTSICRKRKGGDKNGSARSF